MAKNSVRDYSATNSENTDIQSIDISEGCSPAGINNAIREVMADIKDVSSGTVALETPAADRLDVDNLRLDGNTISSTDTNGDITLDPNGTGEVTVVGTLSATAVTGDGSALTGISTGSVLQVLSTTASGFSTTSTSLVDITGASVAITPSSTSSKILVQTSCMLSNSLSDNWTGLALLRGSTQLNGAVQQRADSGGARGENVMLHFFDSPSTTSETTYKLQLRAANGTARAGLSSGGGSSSGGVENSKVIITVLEIAG